MANRILNELFYPIRAQQNKANNADFRTSKPVNTAPDWTGHVMSSANHCTRIPVETHIVCKQGNNIFLLTGLRIYMGEYKAQGPTLCPTEGRALRGPWALDSPV